MLQGGGGGNSSTTDKDYVWCTDFLLDDGANGMGSCCRGDEELQAWCDAHPPPQPPGAGAEAAAWKAACDPTSSTYGLTKYVLSPDNKTLQVYAHTQYICVRDDRCGGAGGRAGGWRELGIWRSADGGRRGLYLSLNSSSSFSAAALDLHLGCA